MSAFPKIPRFTNECFSELVFQMMGKTDSYPQNLMLFHNFYEFPNLGMSAFPKTVLKFLRF